MIILQNEFSTEESCELTSSSVLGVGSAGYVWKPPAGTITDLFITQ